MPVTALDGQAAALERLRMLAIERMAGDEVDADLLIRAGLDAVLAGVDSPSLGVLAGLGEQERSEAAGVFDGVVAELALAPGLGHDPTSDRWTLVRWLARLVAEDELDAVTGARRLAECWHKLGRPDELTGLASWLGEYDSWCPVWSVPRQFYVDRIREEARRISSPG
ncbi:hypothetical protein KALB_8569 [Kutzneria albida DSM 43870]|uniref:Uncharacterized protein n=1 Tax=Kutzneria albida DSM 43870 TaxID=1449976 RepID=W5WMB6_9PSEU|nr:hypothetical protein KALB_8569 [Kutzneria albida DSM 43870]